MIEKSFGLLFFLRQPKNQKSTSRHLYLRITVDGTGKELSLKRTWEVSRWNVAASRAIGTRADARELNNYLEELTAKVYDRKRVLADKGEPVTAQGLKDYLTGTGDKVESVLEHYQKHNERVAALVGHEYAPATLQRFQTSLGHTKAFIQWKYNRDDYDLKKIDYDFVSDYSYWFRAIRKCNANSTAKYLINFKKVILDCLKRGIIDRDPFAGFKIVRTEVNRVALIQEELDAISSKVFPTARLNIVRDIFLFSCYTGLAYVDVRNLRRNHICTGIDGGLWIDTTRQKTHSPTRLPLLPAAIEIMDRYSQGTDEDACEHILPVISNQKANAYLKEIADVCGITKNLTFHIARHTFATTVTLSNGVPIETVSKMLGHKTIRQTQHYAKILDLKISNDMDLLVQKLKTKYGLDDEQAPHTTPKVDIINDPKRDEIAVLGSGGIKDSDGEGLTEAWISMLECNS